MPPHVGWEARHAETLARWPVLAERWARAIERHRVTGDEPPMPTMGPLKEDREVITPKDAIEMALKGQHRKAGAG